MATKKEGPNHYELMLVMTPVLAEEEFRAAQKKVTDLITANGGEIGHSNPWGMRPLAYPIKKKTTGLFWVLEYTAPADVNARMEIMLNRDENVLRYMPTRLDKHAIAYNETRRNRPAPAIREERSEEDNNAGNDRGSAPAAAPQNAAEVPAS